MFMAALYFVAVVLNMRFGLYEPPAITIQKSGSVYAPKTGFLGKLGFSSVEVALIIKDIRAFTRRRELISIFIIPIVFVIIPVMNSLNFSNSGSTISEVNLFFVGMTFLFPTGVMAMTMGNMLIGEEGLAVWRIYASPITPKNLVKSKLFLLIIFSFVVLILTSIVGVAAYQPSLKLTVTAILEGIFLIFAVGSIALSIGFKGADFSATRRARMIRQKWSLISLIVCSLAGLAVLAPLIPTVIFTLGMSFLGQSVPVDPLILASAVTISGIIALAISGIFYKINLNSAAELLRKAEG
jgi:hypothetical protein